LMRGDMCISHIFSSTPFFSDFDPFCNCTLLLEIAARSQFQRTTTPIAVGF
jgi:hypothetical protein